MQVKALHAEHTVASIKSLLPRLHYFDDGTCIVHHMFGAEVTQHVREAYPDAFLTAHFEVSLDVRVDIVPDHACVCTQSTYVHVLW